jgi:hypothetical protein
MNLQCIKLTGTTATGGAATITSDLMISGATLVRVEWIDGDLADGVDAVLSVTNTPSGVDHTLLTLTNADNDANYFPVVEACDNAGAAVTFDGTNEIYVPIVFWGKLKLAITSGGDAKTGGAVVYFRY